MQVDFHYYTVAVLARAAGFSPADALTIAYASQYVDNAVESAPIRIGANEQTSILFDPVRTAPVVGPEDVLAAQSASDRWNRLREVLSNVSWSVQKRVQMTFHFLPPTPLPRQPHAFTYLTRPNSPLARALLGHAAQERDPQRRLCSIGIALHTYADTWAHQGFSGRQHPENDVDAIDVCDPNTGQWHSLDKKGNLFPVLSRIKEMFADHWLDIGHVEALGLPDLTYLVWRYTQGGTRIERHNPRDFEEAARLIYRWFKRLKKPRPAPTIPWQAIDPTLISLFKQKGDGYAHPLNMTLNTNELQQRIQSWQATFGSDPEFFKDYEYAYDPLRWRQEAFRTPRPQLEWERMHRQELSSLQFEQLQPGFWESNWAHFHRAALRQRAFVMCHLP